jgi:hypothetical protein
MTSKEQELRKSDEEVNVTKKRFTRGAVAHNSSTFRRSIDDVGDQLYLFYGVYPAPDGTSFFISGAGRGRLLIHACLTCQYKQGLLIWIPTKLASEDSRTTYWMLRKSVTTTGKLDPCTVSLATS